jgi:hypothetical protein
MIKHVVLLSWKEGTTEEAVAAVTDGFARLRDEIDEIKVYEFGPDAGIYQGNADYVVIGEFENEAEFKTYVKHPKHQALLADVTGPILESFQSVQIGMN